MKARSVFARRLDIVFGALALYLGLYYLLSPLPTAVAAVGAMLLCMLLLYALHLGGRRFGGRQSARRARADRAQAWVRHLNLLPHGQCLRRVAARLEDAHGFSNVHFLASHAVGDIGGARALLCFAQQLEPLDSTTALKWAALARAHRADLILACPGGFSPAAKEALQHLPLRAALLCPDRLAALAPEDFQALPVEVEAQPSLVSLALRREKSRVYLAYGVGLTLLYLMLHTVWALPPALLLLTLALISRTRPAPKQALFA